MIRTKKRAISINAGHTDKATINQRRPLTTNMKLVLADMVKDGGMIRRGASTSDKNALRALMDRGYAAWSDYAQAFTITDAGRVALFGDDRHG